MSEVFLVYGVALLTAWPLGRWAAEVHTCAAARGDRLFLPVEHLLYRLAGVSPDVLMTWQEYAKAILKLHLVIGVASILILTYQGGLPLNPDRIPGMKWDLALHTTASFLTNTNQQHYAGQAQLSYFSHMFAIVAMQVITPSAGIAVLVAILRTMLGAPELRRTTADGRVSVGNFYRDLVRTIVRIVLPLAFVTALSLVWQGVPSTFEGARQVETMDETVELRVQRIALGPVAPMVAIKQIGTNGGGWYGPNSSVPLENPTGVSNFIETVAIILVPIALVVMSGFLTGRRRLAACILAVMMSLSAGLSGLAVWAENQPNPAFAGLALPGPNLEGAEVRLGATATALWGSLTTQTSNGSVNGMHDSFSPLGSVSPCCSACSSTPLSAVSG